MSEKTCSRCDKLKPATSFSVGLRYADGLQSYCKKCNNDAQQEWQKSLSDEAKEERAIKRRTRGRRKYNTDSEFRAQQKAQKKAWYQANAEREREKARIRQTEARSKLDPEIRKQQSRTKAARCKARAAVDPDYREQLKKQQYHSLRKWRLSRYQNLSIERYDAMVQEQNGLCAICGGPPNGRWNRLAVDHCHKTGKVRALLCNRCNSVLGKFDDNIEYLEAAIAYLKKHTT